MKSIKLFYSDTGCVMNKHGAVLKGSHQCGPDLTAAVIREAINAGWRKEPSNNPDIGMVWVPPTQQTT